MTKFFIETGIIFNNYLREHSRQLTWIVMGLVQPLMYLILFTPFLGALTNIPGFPAENALQFFVPSLLILMAIFNTAFAGFPLIDKMRTGFLERLRVTPVNRLALVCGIVMGDAVVFMIQSQLLVSGALLFGFYTSWIGMLILFILLFIIGITMASVSYSLALTFKEEGTLASTVNFFTLPLLLLAGVLLPLEFAPNWIQTIAAFNPFAYAADAAQALVAGNFAQPDILISFIIFVILAGIALRVFIRSMREAVA